jgi:hypothetical protein
MDTFEREFLTELGLDPDDPEVQSSLMKARQASAAKEQRSRRMDPIVRRSLLALAVGVALILLSFVLAPPA